LHQLLGGVDARRQEIRQVFEKDLDQAFADLDMFRPRLGEINFVMRFEAMRGVAMALKVELFIVGENPRPFSNGSTLASTSNTG
jgi:hypothetical protein